MNKILVMAVIVIVVASKAIVLKSILIDASKYERCVNGLPFDNSDSTQVCGIDPFAYFIIGWFVTVAGFIVLIYVLKTNSIKKIIEIIFLNSLNQIAGNSRDTVEASDNQR
jgi:hypothetical protein